MINGQGNPNRVEPLDFVPPNNKLVKQQSSLSGDSDNGKNSKKGNLLDI